MGTKAERMIAQELVIDYLEIPLKEQLWVKIFVNRRDFTAEALPRCALSVHCRTMGDVAIRDSWNCWIPANAGSA